MDMYVMYACTHVHTASNKHSFPQEPHRHAARRCLVDTFECPQSVRPCHSCHCSATHAHRTSLLRVLVTFWSSCLFTRVVCEWNEGFTDGCACILTAETAASLRETFTHVLMFMCILVKHMRAYARRYAHTNMHTHRFESCRPS
jgi:hypothetical protein